MKFIVKESKFNGKGCFAVEEIKKGEKITELTGEIVSQDEINKRIADGTERLDDPLQITENQFIDLDRPSIFFNHSCDPNAGVRGKNELFALKNIFKGEEITYDYSSVVGKNIDWFMSCLCKCGSKNCRKKIGNVLTIPVKYLKNYKKKGVLPDFIKNQF